MNKKLYSDRTVLCYLSHMDLLPYAPLLDSEIGDMVKGMHRFWTFGFQKGPILYSFYLYINTWEFTEENLLFLLSESYHLKYKSQISWCYMNSLYSNS